MRIRNADSIFASLDQLPKTLEQELAHARVGVASLLEENTLLRSQLAIADPGAQIEPQSPRSQHSSGRRRSDPSNSLPEIPGHVNVDSPRSRVLQSSPPAATAAKVPMEDDAGAKDMVCAANLQDNDLEDQDVHTEPEEDNAHRSSLSSLQVGDGYRLAKTWREDPLSEDEGFLRASLQRGTQGISRSRLHNQVKGKTMMWVDQGNGNSMNILDALKEDGDEDSQTQNQNKRTLLLHPLSLTRGVWDIASIILVLYDLVVLPLTLLDLPEGVFLDFMAWLTRVFWSLDIFMTMMSGYVSNTGAIEMGRIQILKNYARSWMLLDVFIVAIDWIELGQSSFDGNSAARIGKAGRGFRTLRMLRLLRMLRVGNIMMMSDRFSNLQSEKMLLLTEVVKIMVGILMMAHCVGCIWYGIGAVALDSNGSSWFEPFSLHEKDWSLRYLASIHWSLSQIQGGNEEFFPTTSVERVYAVAVLLFTFMVTMMFVSRLTSSLTQLHIISSSQEQQFAVLRKYLSHNKISHKLVSRITKSVKFILSASKQNVHAEDVVLLSYISKQLQAELAFELHGGILSHHFFFAKYIDESPQVMKKVCHQAVHPIVVSGSDIIFADGERPSKPVMYVLDTGALVYLAANGKIAYLESEKASYSTYSFISEATLWVSRWVHLGMLKAVDHCSLFEMDAQKFQELSSQWHSLDFSPRVYAANFVMVMNHASEEASVTDLSMMLSSQMLERSYTVDSPPTPFDRRTMRTVIVPQKDSSPPTRPSLLW